MRKIFSIIGWIILTLIVLATCWFMISYIEILIKNVNEGAQYSAWNFFTVFMK